MSVVFCFIWTFFICRFCSFVCVFVVVVWGFLLVLFCFEFYFIFTTKVSVCVTRSTRQPCSGNSGSFWPLPHWTLTQERSFLSVSYLQKGLYLREVNLRGRKGKRKKETCSTSDGRLAA